MTKSTFTGTATTVVAGRVSGVSLMSLGLGDGVMLNGLATGSIENPPPGSLVSSDISQSGEITFANSSPAQHTLPMYRLPGLPLQLP